MSTELPPRPISDDFNPYAPPAAPLDVEPVDLIPAGDLAAAEAIRKAHMGHEASVKSIGMLHHLGAFFCFLGGGGVILAALIKPVFLGPMERVLLIGGGVFYLAMGGLHLALGIGLARLQNWARWTDGVLIALLLALYGFGAIGIIVLRGATSAVLGIFLGCSILGYILYLLVSPKASTIFSAEYKTIIAQTPQIRHRTSLLLKIFLGLFIAIVIIAVISAIMVRPR